VDTLVWLWPPNSPLRTRWPCSTIATYNPLEFSMVRSTVPKLPVLTSVAIFKMYLMVETTVPTTTKTSLKQGWF
jgi:hypothetical protein